MEVDVFRQEVNFLKTELSNGLLSSREGFQGDLSDLLQRVDTGVSISCEVLSNLGDTSKKSVKDHLSFTMPLRQANWALLWKMQVAL
jgi:hypothetical protein